MDSLDHFELSEEEVLDLTLKNNKGIIKIVLEDKYEKSDYEETNHMMKSSSTSLGHLPGEEFIVDNENEDVKEIESFQ